MFADFDGQLRYVLGKCAYMWSKLNLSSNIYAISNYVYANDGAYFAR